MNEPPEQFKTTVLLLEMDGFKCNLKVLEDVKAKPYRQHAYAKKAQQKNNLLCTGKKEN